MTAVLATFNRNRFGALLIVVQVALTLAIVLNSASVIHAQLERMAQTSGVDESNIFTFINKWVGVVTDAPARVARDLALLRATPGVIDAVSTNGVPLSGRGWGTRIDSQPITPDRMAIAGRAALYYLDEHGADALGLSLQSGRWFTAQDIDEQTQPSTAPGVAILSESLARTLFPAGDALGNKVYFYSPQPSVVVGIVRGMKGPDAGTMNGVRNDAVAILPQRLGLAVINNYVVRTKPGELLAVMREAERRLRVEEPQRVIYEKRAFGETRGNTFQRFRALSIVLAVVSTMLLTVTALGIVGLTTYWVTQRRRSIGVRRALGARRADIVGQFQLESATMAGIGIVFGVALTFALNLWLAQELAVPRLSSMQIGVGAFAVLALMQFAALWPALRAATIPPTVATRAG